MRGCRDQILEAIHSVTAMSGRSVFTIPEIVLEMKRRGTHCKESTIRTHITSRMCANAPDHHAVVYDDLIRVR